MCLHVFDLMGYIKQYNSVVISCLERLPKLRSTCVSVLEAYIVPNANFVMCNLFLHYCAYRCLLKCHKHEHRPDSDFQNSNRDPKRYGTQINNSSM
jgi:hypothetical protein